MSPGEWTRRPGALRCVWSSVRPDGWTAPLPQIGCPPPAHTPTLACGQQHLLWAGCPCCRMTARGQDDPPTPVRDRPGPPAGRSTGCSRSSPRGAGTMQAQLSEQGRGPERGAQGSRAPRLAFPLPWAGHASCACCWPWGFSLHARLTGWESRHTLLSLSVEGISLSSKDMVK